MRVSIPDIHNGLRRWQHHNGNTNGPKLLCRQRLPPAALLGPPSSFYGSSTTISGTGKFAGVTGTSTLTGFTSDGIHGVGHGNGTFLFP